MGISSPTNFEHTKHFEFDEYTGFTNFSSVKSSSIPLNVKRLCAINVNGHLVASEKLIISKWDYISLNVQNQQEVNLETASLEEDNDEDEDQEFHSFTDVDTEQISSAQPFIDYLGESRYKQLVNFILRYIADLDVPIKCGNFVELKGESMIVSPVGRGCSEKESDEFEKLDKETRIRLNMIEALKKEFPCDNLILDLSGQISVEIRCKECNQL